MLHPTLLMDKRVNVTAKIACYHFNSLWKPPSCSDLRITAGSGNILFELLLLLVPEPIVNASYAQYSGELCTSLD